MRHNASMSSLAANEDPPIHALRWKNYGSNKNISGFTADNELFGILGMGDTKSIMLRSLCGQHCSFAAVEGTSTRSLNAAATGAASQTYYNEQEIGMGNTPGNFVFIENCDVRNLYENLTVLEVLIFSAEMRIANPAHPSDLAALRLLNEIGLEDISYKAINELSVWEKRAMIFATEVITNKTVVFFDKPTQDLDGHSALSLITVLQRCARSNRLIMITSSSLTFREYAILDRIQLLSDRGYIYIGPGSNAINYFSKLGRTPSPGASISDFLFDLVDESPGFVDLSLLESAVSKLCYKEYTSQYTAADFITNSKSNEVRYYPPVSNSSNHYNNSTWAEAVIDRCFDPFEEERDCIHMPIYLKSFFWCLWRSFTVRWRNIDETFGVWGLAGVFVLLGLLLVFSSFRYNTNLLVADFENTASLLTILPFSIAILSLQWNKDEVIDRYIYSYERDKGYYCHSSIFPIASIIADLFIYRLFPPIFVVALLYPFLGLQSGLSRVCICIAAVTIICMNLACMNRLVFNIMAVKKDFLPVKCSMVSAFLTTLQILYTGLLLNLKNYSSPNALMKSWSSFYWGCNILYWNELANIKFYDSDNDGVLIGADILNDDGAYYVNQRTAFQVLGVQMIIYIVLSVVASILLHREWNYAVKYYYSTLPVYIFGEYTGKLLDRILKYFKAQR